MVHTEFKDKKIQSTLLFAVEGLLYFEADSVRPKVRSITIPT